MKRHNRIFAAAALFGAAFLAGCGELPQHVQTRVEAVSTLIFIGAPKGAAVLVDGKPAARISGKQTRVPIADGTHQVSVISQGQKVWEQAVFIVDGSQKIITLPH